MTDKIVNDTVSNIKSIAKTRGRNVDWAEKAVRKVSPSQKKKP